MCNKNVLGQKEESISIKDKGIYKTNLGILNRGVMLNPNLYLAFEYEEDAQIALKQTICLCRNEDLVFPQELILLTEEEFEEIEGFELLFTDKENGFKVGHNRFADSTEMYGELKVKGNPIRT